MPDGTEGGVMPPRFRPACSFGVVFRGKARTMPLRRRWARHAVGLAEVPVVALSIAVFIAAPWLDQSLSWCGVVGVAAALLGIDRVRGWWGETWTILSAALVMGIAFHWTPAVLAFAMDADFGVGLAIATPIILWDGLRLALPLLLAARVTSDPERAWLPAGLAAVVIESIAPAVFPWKLGYCQAAWPWVVQSVDLFGPEFSTLVLYGHAGLVAWVVLEAGRGGQRVDGALRLRHVSRTTIAALVLCLTNAAYGWWAVSHWSRIAATAQRVSVLLVQANPEDEGGLESLRTLTMAACADESSPPDLVCWPECSGGCYDQRLTSLADPDEVLRLSRPPNAGMRPLEKPICPILFGGKVYEGHPEKPRKLYQSGILVDAGQVIAGRYHKRHLMPFGEYVPGEDVFPDLKRYFPMQDELAAGMHPTVLEMPSARLGVMLCYEDMVSSAARTLAAEGAEVFVSLINGSAFTKRLTLEQHRLLSQLRAVEFRRSLIRCAATGETCVVSPTGTVLERLPLHVRDALLVRVPLLRQRTLYGVTGRVFPIIAALGLTGYILRASRSRAGR